jgi:hypothetical protein
MILYSVPTDLVFLFETLSNIQFIISHHGVGFHKSSQSVIFYKFFLSSLVFPKRWKYCVKMKTSNLKNTRNSNLFMITVVGMYLKILLRQKNCFVWIPWKIIWFLNQSTSGNIFLNLKRISSAVSLLSIMQHTFYFRWHQTFIPLTEMSVKMFLRCLACLLACLCQ